MNESKSQTFQYKAFISYSHADNRDAGRQWATWLHQLIETYEIPDDLVGTLNDLGNPIPARIYPVFRDEEDLPADSDLTERIYHALNLSDCLIVICSPQAVASAYVASEIQYFKQIRSAERILAVLINGEPNASRNAAKQVAGVTMEDECFPKPLLHPVDKDGTLLDCTAAEPIAADFRLPAANASARSEQGWTSIEAFRQHLNSSGVTGSQAKMLLNGYSEQYELMKLKVLAGILAIPLTELRNRDKQYQLKQEKRRARTLRRWLSAVGIMLGIAIIAGLFAISMYHQAEEL